MARERRADEPCKKATGALCSCIEQSTRNGTSGKPGPSGILRSSLVSKAMSRVQECGSFRGVDEHFRCRNDSKNLVT
jgi:hypothetical protein